MAQYRFWLVGDPRWMKGDWANATIAKTKRAAIKSAKSRLAAAEYMVARDLDNAEAQRGECADMNTEAYARLLRGRSNRGGVGGVVYMRYLLLIDGVWLTGPNGERANVTDAGPTARREKAKFERQSDAMMKSMVSALTKSRS